MSLKFKIKFAKYAKKETILDLVGVSLLHIVQNGFLKNIMIRTVHKLYDSDSVLVDHALSIVGATPGREK